MIKAHTSHVDLLERRSQEVTVASDKPVAQEERAESIAHLEAQLMACCDEEARAAMVQRLKAQVDSGSYHIDSTILAQRMQGVLMANPALEAEEDSSPA